MVLGLIRVREMAEANLAEARRDAMVYSSIRLYLPQRDEEKNVKGKRVMLIQCVFFESEAARTSTRPFGHPLISLV